MATFLAVMGNLTASDRRILTAVNIGASTLSFAGSGFIVLCYLLFKELRKFSFKLVFYLALSDMLCSFFSIVGDPSKGFFCYAQGYSTHFFCVASFLWTTTIAFTLHRTVVRHKTDVEDLEPMFHLYVWGTSLVMTVMRSIGNEHAHIGRLGTWCWTETGRTGKAWKVQVFVSLVLVAHGNVNTCDLLKIKAADSPHSSDLCKKKGGTYCSPSFPADILSNVALAYDDFTWWHHDIPAIRGAVVDDMIGKPIYRFC